MSVRTFLFCDVCNPMGIRTVEMRRGGRHRDARAGRRITDGRAWFEGDVEAAQAAGWSPSHDGRHLCPLCTAREETRERPEGGELIHLHAR
ncbi:MAG: hypothetical protein GWN84_14085 [Gammaproteobacteria bacterium]|nr:hypothetical protein [Gammaproteobacteria bacterium]NIR83929.1 hypothetical protein [Gammaproteobacteria bacterium]NIR88972.1 hypothetical protein [Gammaproteobacteria bacterium]NIV74525.1 hypothetical protein [Gammaproteobacteria bacterium]